MMDHPQNMQNHPCPAWSYDLTKGAHGPHEWGALCHQYSKASVGRKQSPVNVVSCDCDEDAGDARGPLDWKALPGSNTATIVNTGHNIQVNWSRTNPGGQLHLNGTEYDFVQLHFHTPAEHTIDGTMFPIEMHMMHYSKDFELAVIVVLFKSFEYDPYVPPQSNLFLHQLYNPNPFNIAPVPLTDQEEPRHVKAVSFDSLNLHSGAFYAYTGSLTTPPCTEAVKWFIMRDVQEASQQEIDAFTQGTAEVWRAAGGNKRPLQKLGKRRVCYFAAASEEADPNDSLGAMEASLAEKDAALAEKDALLAAKDALIASMSPTRSLDQATADGDQWKAIAELRAQLANRKDLDAEEQEWYDSSSQGVLLNSPTFGSAAEASDARSKVKKVKKEKKEKKAHARPGGNWMKSKHIITESARASLSPRVASP